MIEFQIQQRDLVSILSILRSPNTLQSKVLIILVNGGILKTIEYFFHFSSLRGTGD